MQKKYPIALIKKSFNFIASIDVDAQYGFTPFCPDELPVPEGQDVVAELNLQARFARYRIGSKDAHPREAIWITNETISQSTPLEGKNVDVRWPIHCVPGTKGFELIQGLPHPADYDFFVWKGIEPDMHPYGACYHDLHNTLSTGLIEFLFSKKIHTVIVGGLATEFCVKSTALQLCDAGLTVILNLGSCKAFDPKAAQDAIALMRQKGVITIESAKELELALETLHA